ncbi:MAG TPA: histidine kinase [Jatrophihabitans sp.]|nr:histidine kinase [Jatrophihabitans sp.]
MAVAAQRLARGMSVAALTAVVVFGVATIVVIRYTAPWSTTYSGASAAAEAADLAGGLGLLAAGALMRVEWQTASARLATLAGGAWLARDWIGWEGGPPVLRSAAMVASPFVAPLVLALVIAFPDGHRVSRRTRLVGLLAYGAVGLVTVGWVMTSDPRIDTACWNDCTENAFLAVSRPGLAHALTRAGVGIELCLGSVVVLVCAARLAGATAPARRQTWPVLVPGFLIGALLAAHAVTVLRRPLEGPEFGLSAALFQATGWSLALLACGLAWTTARARRVRASVARLASELGAAPVVGSLAAALGAATGDPGLEVSYWIPERAEYVDASGMSVAASEPGSGHAHTPIVRRGEVIAIVKHDATAVSARRLERAIGPGVRLALDNERLRGGLLAQLADLRDSQARIVAAGDAERRRLERNLHDGAQQDLLALAYELRIARAAAAAQPELELLLADATEKAREALIELRELAHGVYPAVLTESGLGAALRTLAETAPVPMHVEVACPERLPQRIEQAVYVLVAKVLEEAVRTGAGHFSVGVARSGDRLLVTLDGHGRGPLTYLTDRLGAVGGTLTADGDLLRAQLPCG